MTVEGKRHEYQLPKLIRFETSEGNITVRFPEHFERVDFILSVLLFLQLHEPYTSKGT